MEGLKSSMVDKRILFSNMESPLSWMLRDVLENFN